MQKVSGAVSMKPKQKKALITLLVIFGIAMLGNILLTLYYLNFLKQDFHFFLAIGLLVAQPCILSIWCALGGQRAVVRIPAFMGMLALLFIVYMGILVSSGAPGSIVSILGVCVIAITLIIQIPLDFSCINETSRCTTLANRIRDWCISVWNQTLVYQHHDRCDRGYCCPSQCAICQFRSDTLSWTRTDSVCDFLRYCRFSIEFSDIGSSLQPKSPACVRGFVGGYSVGAAIACCGSISLYVESSRISMECR